MKSILIVEDDPTLLTALSDNFRSRQFAVTTASDGNVAYAEASRGDVDVILLDVMLPEMDGYEICRRVREDGLDTPIVMLTAKGQEEDIVRGLHWGADDYVSKPFSIRELVARVEAILRRTKPVGEVIHFGACQLDRTAHQLCRNGQRVPLTSKEYRLLLFFVERPGRALTRHEILNEVWGRNVIVTARSVDRCVTTLRSKIEPDPRNPSFITTIRDIGYRFEQA